MTRKLPALTGNIQHKMINIEFSHCNSTAPKQQNASTAPPAGCRAPDVDHVVHGHLLAHHLEEGGNGAYIRELSTCSAAQAELGAAAERLQSICK